MATNNNSLKSALASFGKTSAAAFKKAQADAMRTPLMTQGTARLKRVDPIAAGKQVIEKPTGNYVLEWPNQLDFTFDLMIDGRSYELHKKVRHESAQELEKLHKGVDLVVSLTTGELSRYWGLEDQCDWMMKNSFPAYASLYKGRECFRFGEVYNDEEEARKAIEAEQEK